MPTRGLSDDPAKWLDEAVEACREEQRKRKVQKLVNPLERDIQRSILDYCKLQRILIWRSNTGGMTDAHGHHIRFGVPGQADLTGIMPDNTGRRLEVEVKRPGGKQSKMQRAFAERIARAGGVYLVVTSVEEFIKAIAAVRR